jgi:hypothetical protein
MMALLIALQQSSPEPMKVLRRGVDWTVNIAPDIV